MESNKIKTTDVIIIGGGPAGISAAIWCNELGLSAVLFEGNTELGGQLLWTYNEINNYPGISASNGRELRDIFLKHALLQNLNFVTGNKILKVDLSKKEAVLESGEIYSSRAMIIATGIRRRKLTVEGEEEFIGKGILESGKRDSGLVAGKRVCVVGGGDAALENALIVAETAASVTLLHRSDRFTARDEFLEKARTNKKIKILTNSKVERITGDQSLNSIEILDLKTGESRVCPADNLLIRIGVEPNAELFSGQIEQNEKGYVKVDAECRTSLANVFAIGDVANPVSPTIATAVGTGATAAKAAYSCLKN